SPPLAAPRATRVNASGMLYTNAGQAAPPQQMAPRRDPHLQLLYRCSLYCGTVDAHIYHAPSTTLSTTGNPMTRNVQRNIHVTIGNSMITCAFLASSSERKNCSERRWSACARKIGPKLLPVWSACLRAETRLAMAMSPVRAARLS